VSKVEKMAIIRKSAIFSFVLKNALTLLFCLFIAFLPSLVFILTFEMHYFTKRVLKTVGASQVQSVMIEILTIIGQSAIFS
jgi:uncharacterized membrane protein